MSPDAAAAAAGYDDGDTTEDRLLGGRVLLRQPRRGLRAGLDAVLLAAGVPRDYAEFLVLILGHFKAGHAERTTTAVADITGRQPGRFEQYARDYRAAWLG